MPVKWSMKQELPKRLPKGYKLFKLEDSDDTGEYLLIYEGQPKPGRRKLKKRKSEPKPGRRIDIGQEEDD